MKARRVVGLVVGAGLGAVLMSARGCAPGPQVVVSVAAQDPNGAPLHYRWKSTDGTIQEADSPSTIWTLPAGPGLHFAYVLVSNGRGGYVERRVIVSTDDIGVRALPDRPTRFRAPAAPVPPGFPVRAVIRSSFYYPAVTEEDGTYIPDTAVMLRNVATDAGTALALTDGRGNFVLQGVEPGVYDEYCSMDPAAPLELCHSNVQVDPEALNDPYSGPAPGRGHVGGRAVLSEGAACGTINEFFDVEAEGLVTLLDDAGTVLAGPYRQDTWGHWSLAAHASASAIRLECEGTAPVAIPIPGTDEAPRVVFPDSSLPVISGLSAKLDGGEISVALPAPPPRPSDLVSDPEWFLSAKGIDSRASACRYYQAIGAVSACDGSGTPKEPKEGRVEKEAKEPEESRQPGKLQGAITFDDWKRATGLAPFGRGGATEVSATYVNRVDLGLTRNHHSVSYGPGQVAAYVCNHLGPLDGSKAAIDTAVDNAVHGRNLVACVGMDHGVTPGVNGDQPFTRFLIFGPSGELLPSVNLDGRREKFVPGVCVACHGGSKYAGRYPTSGPSRADIGAHFLPYDTGNFAFSTQVGLREVDQAAALKALNLNVLQTGPTPPTQELIAGWYADGGTLLDKDYLPTSWAPTSPVAQTFYREVYARSCRTCHVAFGETLNFDHFDNLAFTAHPDGNGALGERGSLRTAISACSGFSASFVRNFSMPNSLTTFNLFWGSAGQAVDQPALMAAFLQEQGELGPGEVCSLHAEPVP